MGAQRAARKFTNRRRGRMTTLRRKVRRSKARRTGTDWPTREQETRINSDGGYSYLHPTKGWVKVSAKRLRAHGIIR